MPATEKRVSLDGKLPAARSLSPTSASSWLQCELKYALSYLFGWQEPSTVQQLIGNVVHRAVELLYGLEPANRRRATASELLRDALAGELVRPTYASLIGGGDPSDDVLAAGDEALDGLFAIEEPATISVGPEGLEVWVEADLYGAPVRGRIDRLYDAQGAYVVADYKTGRVPSPRYTMKAFFGLWTYAAALASADADHRLADRIELLYLIGRQRLARPVLHDVALEQAKVLARIWRAISAANGQTTLTARRGPLCDWCAFKPACPAHVKHLPAPGSPEHDALLALRGLTRRTRNEVAIALERVDDRGAEVDVP